MSCSVDGCTNHVARAGLCWGHWKRKKRGLVVAVPLQPKPKPTLEAMLELAILYANVEGDELAYLKVKDNFRTVADRYHFDKFGLGALHRRLDVLTSRLAKLGEEALDTASQLREVTRAVPRRR